MEILGEKVNAHLPYYSTLKSSENFFQTFQAGILFFTTEEEHSCSLKRLEENIPELFSVL